ncbi:hypothetical protein ACFOLJ_04900 [Rugamonas sp. CCM 8940]
MTSLSPSPAQQAARVVAPAATAAGATVLPAIAVGLSAESAIVASLGTAASVQMYTPAGLLAALQQAGSAAEPPTLPPPGSDTQFTAAQELDQGLIDSLAATPAASGIYDGAGVVQSLPGAPNIGGGGWAELLRSKPELAAGAVADSTDLALVGTLRTTA